MGVRRSALSPAFNILLSADSCTKCLARRNSEKKTTHGLLLADFMDQLTTLSRSSFAGSPWHIHPLLHLITFRIHMVVLEKMVKAAPRRRVACPSHVLHYDFLKTEGLSFCIVVRCSVMTSTFPALCLQSGLREDATWFHLVYQQNEGHRNLP